jgi:hypothetical protein
MSNGIRKSLQIEWFNVTYRSVVTAITLLVAAALGSLGYFYYFHIHVPKSGAAEALSRAERRLDEASRLGGDPAIAEILGSATGHLEEARETFGDARYDDSRVAAIRSENLSLQVLRTAGGQQKNTRAVRFLKIEGDVRVKRSGEFSWDSANTKMVLEIGDQVKTSSSGSAKLIYFDGAVTTIASGSLLEIRELYEDPVTRVKRVTERLNFGEIRASTQKVEVAGSFHEVTTQKSAAKTAEAADFRVKSDPEKGTAEYDVFQGGVVIESPDRRESLVAGEGIRANSRGELSAKQALPAVPRLLSPRDQRVYIFERPQDERISLSWETVPGAQKYQLIISDKDLFTNPLYDAERTGTSATLEGVGSGSYYWKVAAVAAAGTRGPFSGHRRFRVSSQKIMDRSDSEPPVLEITEFVPIGLMVIVNGRTEPGATLWADNEKIEVSDDGIFYAVLRLRKEGVNQLRFVAQDTAGNEAEVVKSTYVEMY